MLLHCLCTHHLVPVTIAGSVLAAILFFNEFFRFFSADIITIMAVDTSRAETLPIHFNITFPHLPCSVLSLDALDASGKHDVDVSTNVWKSRVDYTGRLIPGGSEKHDEEIDNQVAAQADSIMNDLTSFFHLFDVTLLREKVERIRRDMDALEGCNVGGYIICNA